MLYYKYIYFKEVKTERKTGTWMCKNNRSDDDLGIVKWYGPWRQYCFFPNEFTIFNKGCLDDIQDFISKQMEARK